MLTRPKFDAACRALIEKYGKLATPSIQTAPFVGWSWNEHPMYPNFGYMTRAINIVHRPTAHLGHDDELVGDVSSEELDPSIVDTGPNSHQLLICHQHVVFSATFRVPAFYFTMCTPNGAPLPLSDIIKSSLFKINACEGVEVSSFALSLPTSAFPLLSHGDHPTLGTPCWYFHPCETTKVVEELLCEVKEDEWSEETKLVRWLELWFMVLGSIVNL